MKLINFATAVALVTALGSAQAALFDRGSGLIYDDVLNITWMQNANYVSTSGYLVNGFPRTDGLLTHTEAYAWASELVYGGYDDWRLPRMIDTGGTGCDYSGYGGTDCGWNPLAYNPITKTVYSELASLYQTKNVVGDPTSLNGIKETYWFGTTYAGGWTSAWTFNMYRNIQSHAGIADRYAAWAVRDGDVAPPSPVPAPPAFILMLTGLGLLGLTKRFRKENV